MSFVLSGLKQRPVLGLLLIYAAVLLFNGPSVTDLDDFLTISRNTGKIMVPVDREFLYSSPINFFLGNLFGATYASFYIIHALEIIAMLLCIGISVREKIPASAQQTTFLVLLSLTPLWLITFKWFGKTDPVIIGGLFLCWAFRARWRLLVAFIMIVAHREMGTLAILFLYFLEDEKDHNLLAVLVAGNAFHLLYQYGILDHAPQSRPMLVLQDMKPYIQSLAEHPQVFVATMFCWFWAVIFLFKPNRKETLIYAAAFLMASVCSDFTRDFIMVALPAIIFHAARVAAQPSALKLENLLPLALVQIQMAAHAPDHAFDNQMLIWLGAHVFG